MTRPLERIRISPSAQPLVTKALERAEAGNQVKIEQALAEAAGQNGDRYLNATEVSAVLDAFEQASGSETAKLSGTTLDTALELARSATESMSSASNVDGVSAHFTTQESLESKLISELHEAVARAGGRKLDVHMMIFQFQSKEVEAAIMDLAEQNPNVTFRIVADSTQATSSGGKNALPRMVERGLPNVQVKYKPDFPYGWSQSADRAVYNNALSQGLNHHKGFATFIEGVPDRMAAGSFNWSDTADEKNYEDLIVVEARDAATRRMIEQYQDEFTGYFNDDTASLSPNAFANFKSKQFSEISEKNGNGPVPFVELPDDDHDDFVPTKDVKSLDVNGFRDSDRSRLEALVGKTVTSNIYGERTRNGRFASLEELKERVPSVAALSAAKLKALETNGQFGSHEVSVNVATAEELDNAGFSESLANAIVAHREKHGDFESVDQVLNVAGSSVARMNFARRYLEDDDMEGFFNSRRFNASSAGTGYGAESSVRTTPAMDEHGQVSRVAASVTAGVVDMFSRARPGEEISVAMYSMNPSSREYKALQSAAERGVAVRVVLNADYTESAVNALKALQAKGLAVDVRVQSAKTMHEKFAVVGDDTFAGSANFSESSSTKHSEERWFLKNNVEVSTAFKSQFELLWAKSRIV